MEKEYFMNEKDVMCAVEAFIRKYSVPPAQKVEWPQLGLKLKGVLNVKINEVSLKFQEGVKKLWTFKGTADIENTDERSTVSTRTRCAIIGSAKFSSYKNPTDGYLLPDMEEVTITKVSPITKSEKN